MSRREKRLRKLRQNPKNVSLEELSQVLTDFGFWLDTVNGSHHVFRNSLQNKAWKLTIPFRKPVLAIYVKQAIVAIDEVIAEQNTLEMSEEITNNDDSIDEEN
jgi:predicted RNA binding protein YcfA (HicA-like mRNA interferase family)